MNLKRRLLEYALNSLQANLSEAVEHFGDLDFEEVDREVTELRLILGMTWSDHLKEGS